MRPADAWQMGYRVAAAGFFFDGMEIVAAVSPSVPGGIDAMRGAIEPLFRERDAVNAHGEWLAAMIGGAFGQPVPAPRGVDEYRALMTGGVFEIVNRWSLIADIKQVNRLQAWFYAGFGLGRAETVLKGMDLAVRLRECGGVGTAADQMPSNLQRMAAESAKQLEVAGKEDDLRSVRPLFEDAAARMRRAALVLSCTLEEVAAGEVEREDLRALADSRRKIELDVARVA